MKEDEYLWWRRSWGVQLLHLGLALGSKSLSHLVTRTASDQTSNESGFFFYLFLRFGLKPLHPLVLLELLLGHAQGRGSLCHLQYNIGTNPDLSFYMIVKNP